MFGKAAIILAWFLVSYLLLVFVATEIWQGLLLSISLGLAMAGIGFSIQHDANHGGFSRSSGTNRLFALTLDLLGGSSHYWTLKHNVVHHTYPNIAGVDDDIDLGPLARLAPLQRRRRWHRHQALYIWVLYALLAFKWHFVDDVRTLLTGHIGVHRVPALLPRQLATIIVGKLVFFGWAVALPLALHSVAAVVLFYVATAMTLGFTLALVFQLAHCVEEADFPCARRLHTDWATHQIESTVDFAPKNRWLTWYIGGLNHQIEHHLFPRMCHVHYPSIAPIVEATCRDFEIPYRTNTTLAQAVRSHFRWLSRMGDA
jgi:linoleoyl-CoA desaturase